MQDDKVTSKQNKIRIRQRNAGMTYRKWISVFLCVIFVCGLLAGCGNDKVQEEQNDNVSANTIPEDVVVHTDYGDLHYPDRWQEYVTIRQEQNGNTIAVTFETKSGEETYELFKVLIGDDSSEVVGSLTDDTGTQRNVYLHVEELPADSGLEETEQTRFYAMQEDFPLTILLSRTVERFRWMVKRFLQVPVLPRNWRQTRALKYTSSLAAPVLLRRSPLPTWFW